MGLRLGATSGQGAEEARVEEALSQLITQLTNEINWCMHARGLTRADLANRMGVSAGRVSQVLSGGENLTLRTLASLATALDARFSLELKDCGPTAITSGELTGIPATATMSDPAQAAAPGYSGAMRISRRR
jgi:transcriptional regulator with XRE-family HTH domain